MLTGNRCKFCKKRLGEKFYVKGSGACCAECYNTTRCGIFNIPDNRLHISIFYYQITHLNILSPDYNILLPDYMISGALSAVRSSLRVTSPSETKASTLNA